MNQIFKVFVPENLNISGIENIINSGKLNSGQYLKIFEEQLREYIGNPFTIVTSNNNYASLIAFALLDLKHGDEVITSPMACLASNMPILNFRAKAVWADIDPYTGTLDPISVQKKITSKTRAILHYHWGGYPGYVDEINEIGISNGIPVIDDAIESFGSEYKGKKFGNLGTEITTFSFQTVRLPNSVDGGGISFKSKELFEKSILMRDFGINRSNFRDENNEISSLSDISHFGYNAIMNEINAFIGTKVMEETPRLIKFQRNNALILDSYCESKKYKRLNERSTVYPNYWVYSFLTNNQMEDFQRLRSKGIYASKVHLRNDYYSAFGQFDSSLKGVHEFERKQLSVPCGWWINYSSNSSLLK